MALSALWKHFQSALYNKIYQNASPIWKCFHFFIFIRFGKLQDSCIIHFVYTVFAKTALIHTVSFFNMYTAGCFSSILCIFPIPGGFPKVDLLKIEMYFYT